MGVSPNLHSLPPIHDYMGPKFMSLTDDFDSERVPGNSLDERASSLDSYVTLSLNEGGGEGHTTAHMPLLLCLLQKYKMLS